MADLDQKVIMFRCFLARLSLENFSDDSQVSRNRIHSLHRQIIHIDPAIIEWPIEYEQELRRDAYRAERNNTFLLGQDFAAVPAHERSYLLEWCRKSFIYINNHRFMADSIATRLSWYLSISIFMLRFPEGTLNKEQANYSQDLSILMTVKIRRRLNWRRLHHHMKQGWPLFLKLSTSRMSLCKSTPELQLSHSFTLLVLSHHLSLTVWSVLSVLRSMTRITRLTDLFAAHPTTPLVFHVTALVRRWPKVQVSYVS